MEETGERTKKMIERDGETRSFKYLRMLLSQIVPQKAGGLPHNHS